LIWADLLVCVTWEKEVASEGPIREQGGACNERYQSESEEEIAMKRSNQRAGRLHLKDQSESGEELTMKRTNQRARRSLQ